MNIAVLSGKGGTGKTMLSVNLAKVAGKSAYVDCDVEEPNGHLFLKPEGVVYENISVPVPEVDQERCDGCRKCVEFCRFNALVFLLDRVKVYTDMCHSCGGCPIICPQKAISERPRSIGHIESGKSGDISVYTGIMDVGEVSGIPIIDRLLEMASSTDEITFIDCPPGSSCSVMESIKDADFCVLVTEPTIFGAHNMKMVAELAILFEKPFGVVLNKGIKGERDPSEEYCLANDIPIIGRIPFDRGLGDLGSEAKIAAEEDDRFRYLFEEIFENIMEMAI